MDYCKSWDTTVDVKGCRKEGLTLLDVVVRGISLLGTLQHRGLQYVPMFQSAGERMDVNTKRTLTKDQTVKAS